MKTEFLKPVRIVFEFRLFSAYSLFTKKFLILNFEWLDTKLLELIYIVSSDYRADMFSYSFASIIHSDQPGFKTLLRTILTNSEVTALDFQIKQGVLVAVHYFVVFPL